MYRRVRPLQKEKSAKRFLPLLLLLIPLAGFLAWMGGGDDGVADSAFREGHAVGDRVSVDTGTTRPVLVALDHESVGALVDMRTGAIQVGITSIMNNQDKYLELEAGTKVLVLAFANEDREAKVRIIEGPSVEPGGLGSAALAALRSLFPTTRSSRLPSEGGG